MAVYISQIEKRRAAERATMAEVAEKTSKRLGLQAGKRVVPQNDESALRQVLEALGITDYELEDDDMLSPEEQLTGILRPRGIMMRDGTSLVICNTDKGEKLLTDVSNSLILKEVEYDEAIRYNSAAIKSVNRPGSRELFFKYLKHHSIMNTFLLFCGEDKRSKRKVQFLEDYNDVKKEKGIFFAIIWAIKNKLIQK